MIRCKTCLQELKAHTTSCYNCGTLVHPLPVEYFYTPPLRFLLLACSIPGIGAYYVYWFYKNWAAVKKAQGTQSMYPFWRSIFSVIFCWSLFGRIYSDAKQHGYKRADILHKVVVSLMITYVTFAYALHILNKIIESNVASGSTPAYSLSSSLLLLITILIIPLKISAFLITQHAIQFYNLHAIPGYQKKRKLTKGEIVFTVCGVAIYSILVMIILAASVMQALSK